MKRSQFFKALGSIAALSILPQIILPQEKKSYPLIGIVKDPFAQEGDLKISEDGKEYIMSGKWAFKSLTIPKGVTLVMLDVDIDHCDFIFEKEEKTRTRLDLTRGQGNLSNSTMDLAGGSIRMISVSKMIGE